ncbi:winged helix-turn-helix transcriptional regulator [Candidatus Gottesmanbacteria bacterium]|nr:winged helix-turn-helix transcriptional regulator [Candidatus Gottesmanbacteria bacterium]
MKVHNISLQPINPGSVKKAQNLMPQEALLEIVVECFKALGDATRAKILYALGKQPLCVRDLAIIIGISESAVSHQLSFLKDKRLVKVERSGNVMNYSIAYQHITKLLKEAEYYADHIRQNLPDHPGKNSD